MNYHPQSILIYSYACIFDIFFKVLSSLPINLNRLKIINSMNNIQGTLKLWFIFFFLSKTKLLKWCWVNIFFYSPSIHLVNWLFIIFRAVLSISFYNLYFLVKLTKKFIQSNSSMKFTLLLKIKCYEYIYMNSYIIL